MTTTFESYYNYEVHATSDRMWVKLWLTDDEWVEQDVLEADGITNMADALPPTTAHSVIEDTLTVFPPPRDLSFGFAGAFLWEETKDAIATLVSRHEL